MFRINSVNFKYVWIVFDRLGLISYFVGIMIFNCFFLMEIVFYDKYWIFYCVNIS